MLCCTYAHTRGKSPWLHDTTATRTAGFRKCKCNKWLLIQ